MDFNSSFFIIFGFTKYLGSFLFSSLLISITIILFGTPICIAAKPIPFAAYIVSNISSINLCSSFPTFSTDIETCLNILFGSVIIVLIGLLLKQFNPNIGERVELKGENKFLFDPEIPEGILDELAWGSETILTSTAAATLLIHNNGKNILRRGIISNDDFYPGETCMRSIKDMKLISLANTKFYPGRDEFLTFCPNVPSILIIPINIKAFILIGGWSNRCFTKSDEKWISNWAKKLNNIFLKNSY